MSYNRDFSAIKLGFAKRLSFRGLGCILLLFSLISSLIGSLNTYAATFSVKSSALKAGEPISMDQVFNGFGCKGKNISPDLEWSHAPAGTQAFAVTVYDPDAPTGSGWWHWVVFNIPANVKKLALNAGDSKGKSLPSGAVQSKTDFGTTGYGGPCPPQGSAPHHYYVRVYALKDKLPLSSDTPAAQVGFYINQNKLAEAEIMSTYQR